MGRILTKHGNMGNQTFANMPHASGELGVLIEFALFRRLLGQLGKAFCGLLIDLRARNHQQLRAIDAHRTCLCGVGTAL